MVQFYNDADTATTLFHLRLNFYMNDNPSIAVHIFPKRTLASLSVDEILASFLFLCILLPFSKSSISDSECNYQTHLFIQ